MTGVVVVEEKFAILDEEAYLKEIYEDTGVRICPALFEINGPFLLDSQFEAQKNPDRRIRKRKRPHQENHLTKEQDILIELVPQIRKAGEEAGFFSHCKEKDNNRRARTAAAEVLADYPLIERSFDQKQQVFLSDGDSISLASCSGWYQNPLPSTIRITVNEYDSRSFYIPPGATFCQGDVSSIKDYPGKFDLLVMDPPWMNRSAKRTAGYKLSDEAVFQLTIDGLSEGGLCCVWITNRKGLKEEVVSLLKDWGLELVSTWYWLKVTKAGEPVCSFNLAHKVPFETILVFCWPKKFDHWSKLLSKSFVFASVPMAVHSRKPPMPLILKALDISFFRSCELFARSLLRNCVSVGLEPLLMQNSKNFE